MERKTERGGEAMNLGNNIPGFPVVVDKSGIGFGEYRLEDLILPDVFCNALGTPDRTFEIKMHPSGKRIRMSWDRMGVEAFADYPEARMSHMNIHFAPGSSPQAPAATFPFSFSFNEQEVDGHTSDKLFPFKGNTPVSAMEGAQAGQFNLFFVFEPVMGRSGRPLKFSRLSFASISWTQRTDPSSNESD
jgi:hypothetical protein